MSKKLLSIVAITMLSIFFSLQINAQSLEVIANEPKVSGAETDDLIPFHCNVKNVSMNTKLVKVRVETIESVSGHQLIFCFGITCYPPFSGNFEMPNGEPENIKSGDTSFYGLKIELIPNGIKGKTVAKIIFMVEGNQFDKAEIIVEYYAGVTGVEDLVIRNVRVYPNPASSSFTFSTGDKLLPAGTVLNLINSQGLLVKTIPVGNENQLVNTSELPSGSYLMNILSEGKNFNSNGSIIISK